MNDIDLSTEALLARRALSEKATPGPWLDLSNPPDRLIGCVNCRDKHIALCNVFDRPGSAVRVTREEQRANAAHIAANSPDVVMADIDEILRLRSLVAQHEEYIAALELEAASADQKIGKLAVLLGIEHDAGNMRTIAIIKNEIIQLQAKAERPEKEADWLADHCREFCESYGYCGECPMFSGWLKRDREDCGETVGYRGDKHTANWREAAREAVEESCKK